MPKKVTKEPVVSKKAPAKKVVKKKAAKKETNVSPSKVPFKEVLKSVGGLEDWRNQAPHIMVYAYAGTGKTFTQIVGCAKMFAPEPLWEEIEKMMAVRAAKNKGLESGSPGWDKFVSQYKVVPSDEQAAIWGLMGMEKPRSIVYCAFNKSIVTEFSEQWGWLTALLAQKADIQLKFATVNSLGHGTIFKQLGRMTIPPGNQLVKEITAEIMQVPYEVATEDHGKPLALVTELVRFCKLSMIGWTPGDMTIRVTKDDLMKLIVQYAIEAAPDDIEKAYQLVPEVINRSIHVARYQKKMTFDDQNWLPLVMNMPIDRHDLLMVDESQDLPKSKQEYVVRAGKRIMAVGDTNQAIYGWAGADCEAMLNLEAKLKSMGDVRVRKLTETRRCAQAVVAEAQQEVPDFKAHVSNPIGSVKTLTLDSYRKNVKDKDMCLCRNNAPLIGQALAFIKENKKVSVRGRDFGKSLIKFITDFRASSIEELIKKTEQWYDLMVQSESRKREISQANMQLYEDKRDCVLALSEGVNTVEAVVGRVNLLFKGVECPECRKLYDEGTEYCYDCKKFRGTEYRPIRPEGILLSTVHKAKGLEAGTVYVYRHKAAPIPSGMARTKDAKKQEKNLLYIAKTRAITNLVYVVD